MKALGRTFNLERLAAGVLIALFVLLLIKGFASFGLRFDPFNSLERRADREAARADAAVQDSAARRIEAAGANDTTTRVEAVQRQAAAADHAVFSLTTDARIALDAKDPLDRERERRLRHFDQQLCDARPALCADAPAAPRNAGDGHAALPAGPPAR